MVYALSKLSSATLHNGHHQRAMTDIIRYIISCVGTAITSSAVRRYGPLTPPLFFFFNGYHRKVKNV